jgi:uncharacterized membrane protein YraQ (UPF0718 family)
MKFLKRFYKWEKKQMKNPETVLAVWVAFGVVLGIGMDNIGAGVAIGVAIGVAMYTTKKRGDKESSLDKNGVQISKDIK